MVGSTFERKMGWGTVGEWEYGQAFTESSITPSRLLGAPARNRSGMFYDCTSTNTFMFGLVYVYLMVHIHLSAVAPRLRVQVLVYPCPLLFAHGPLGHIRVHGLDFRILPKLLEQLGELYKRL